MERDAFYIFFKLLIEKGSKFKSWWTGNFLERGNNYWAYTCIWCFTVSFKLNNHTRSYHLLTLVSAISRYSLSILSLLCRSVLSVEDWQACSFCTFIWPLSSFLLSFLLFFTFLNIYWLDFEHTNNFCLYLRIKVEGIVKGSTNTGIFLVTG